MRIRSSEFSKQASSRSLFTVPLVCFAIFLIVLCFFCSQSLCPCPCFSLHPFFLPFDALKKPKRCHVIEFVPEDERAPLINNKQTDLLLCAICKFAQFSRRGDSANCLSSNVLKPRKRGIKLGVRRTSCKHDRLWNFL